MTLERILKVAFRLLASKTLSNTRKHDGTLDTIYSNGLCRVMPNQFDPGPFLIRAFMELSVADCFTVQASGQANMAGRVRKTALEERYFMRGLGASTVRFNVGVVERVH
jgi:hypothetical protein